MKLVQVIPIPVTYSRNLKSFLAKRSWISWQLLFLSLFLRRCRTTETRKPGGTPRRDISANLFSLRYFHGSMTTAPLISAPEENRQSRGKCPTKILAPFSPPKTVAPFSRRIVWEQSWKNRGKIRFRNGRIFGGEEVFQASRVVLLWPRVMV